MTRKFLPAIFVISACLAMTGGCTRYSPDTYGPSGMQQANKVDRAVVVNFREVDVNDPALGLGTAAGAAAGGIAGAQIGSGGGNALATLGGVLIGGGIGYLIDQEANSTKAFEYILEKKNGDLMTLAQKQMEPIPVGTRVFILYGVKARVIPENVAAQETKATNPANPAD